MAALEQRVSSMDSKGMQFAKQQLEKFGWTEGDIQLFVPHLQWIK